jgi:hypothetical protein
MSIFAQLASPVWKQLEGYGLDPAAVFRKAGIAPEVVHEPGARIPYKALDRLYELASEMSRDACFGLRQQQYFRPAHLGALGFTWLASNTIRTAFQRMSRYARMINEDLSVMLADEGANLFVIQGVQPFRHEALGRCATRWPQGLPRYCRRPLLPGAGAVHAPRTARRSLLL